MTDKYFCPYCKAELKPHSRNSYFYQCKCDNKYDYLIHWFKVGNNWNGGEMKLGNLAIFFVI